MVHKNRPLWGTGKGGVNRHREAGVTRGRFFSHTSADAPVVQKNRPLCSTSSVKRTVPFVSPPQSTEPSHVPRQLSPKGATHHWVAHRTDSSPAFPGSSPGVSPVGGRSPLTGRFKGVQGGNRNPPWPLSLFVTFSLWRNQREKVKYPVRPLGGHLILPLGESPRRGIKIETRYETVWLKSK